MYVQRSLTLRPMIEGRRLQKIDNLWQRALCGTKGSPRGCSEGGLCIDGIRRTQGERLVRSHVSDSSEIADPEEPILPLEFCMAPTKVIASVKLNNNQCEPIKRSKRSLGTVPDSFFNDIESHRP